MEYGEDRAMPRARNFTPESALMVADAYIMLAEALTEANHNREMWKGASACGEAARDELAKLSTNNQHESEETDHDD